MIHGTGKPILNLSHSFSNFQLSNHSYWQTYNIQTVPLTNKLTYDFNFKYYICPEGNGLSQFNSVYFLQNLWCHHSRFVTYRNLDTFQYYFITFHIDIICKLVFSNKHVFWPCLPIHSQCHLTKYNLSKWQRNVY